MAIGQEQVQHVARLARLALDEDEKDAMARELSGVLEHIEKISELDLVDVAPTSHVVDLVNVLREDVPRAGLDRDTALEQAPDATETGFRVPSPGAA